MADIKTRQINKGGIKTIDRAANLNSCLRSVGVKSRDHIDSQAEPETGNEISYAGERTVAMADGAMQGTARMSVSGGGYVKRDAEKAALRIDARTKGKMIRSSRAAEGGVLVRQSGIRSSSGDTMHPRSSHTAVRPVRIRTRRNIEMSPVREGKSIKTASSTAAKRMTIQAKRNETARKAMIRTRRITQQIKQEMWEAVTQAYRSLKRALAGMKALILSLVAGGWIAVLVIIVFVFFGAAFFFFGDESSSNYTPVSAEVEAYTPLIQKYAEEFGIPEYVDLIKAVMMQESGGRGKDPMQAAEGPFNKKYPKEPNGIKDPDYSIQCGIQELKSVLEQADVENPLDMEHIRLALQGYNYGNGYIPWAIKRDGGYTVENAVVFSDEQAKKHGWKSYGDKQYVAHVLRYYPYGNYNYGIGNTKITQVAAQQIGNAGGKKFWSWYGFSSRVPWCACYVSWCADQCGYIKAGIIPKFAAVTDGIQWFEDKNQWQRPGYQPMPGDIIFFDWQCDGHSDHVGIVEKCDGETVYTIEGNSGDKCQRCTYSIHSPFIYGYGIPKY